MRLSWFAPSRRALILRASIAITLTLGYADLVRGGITLSALLLVVAYLVLIPASLLLD